MLSCSSDSEPSFDSPSEDDEFDMHDDEDDDGVGVAAPPPSKSFRGPQVDSQEESVAGSPFALATQPYTTSTAPGTQPFKKRKVSLSPRDSLARPIPRRQSPRSAALASVNRETDKVIEILDRDDDDVVGKKVNKTGKAEKSSTPAWVAEEPISANTPPVEVPHLVQERDSLKTTLFPEEVNVDRSSASTRPVDAAVAKKKRSKDPSDKKVVGKSESKPQKANVPTARTKPASKEREKSSETTEPCSTPKPSGRIATDKKSLLSTTPSQSAEACKATSNTATVVTAQPAKKKKKKKSFQDELLHLMFMTGKPYTVKCLVQEMKGASESAIEFCFLSLVDKGWVVKKEFASKSRTKELYWGNQECKNKELMDILDMVPPQQIQQAKQELQQLQQQDAHVSRELEAIFQEPSNEELNSQLLQSEQQVQDLERRLKETHERVRAASGERKPQPTRPGVGLGRKAVSTKPISSKRMKQKINDMRLQWKKRKEKCVDFVENMSEAMEKKPKEVEKLLQLETDEMVGVTMPPRYDQI
jgi:hypothetical protein